jgi:two-component system chemotaxis response regulator CheB
VCEADDKAPLTPACVFVGPADYHLMVEEGRVALSTDAPVNFSRPSIDVLFESAADAYGPGLVAVVLTGANDDGAAGVRRVLERGGRVVIQDPAGAERAEMPTAAIAAAQSVGGRAEVVALDRIAEYLLGMVGASR